MRYCVLLMMNVWSLPPMASNSIAFDRLVGEMLNGNRPQITSTDYEQFKKQWVFDALKGYRFGQSFCEYFNINNSIPLYWFRDNNISERWIKDNYLQK